MMSITSYELKSKQASFQRAIYLYENHKRYRLLNRVASFVIMWLHFWVCRNCITIVLGSYNQINGLALLLALVLAYIVTDFINGLIHLFMDCNDNYESLVGPFIAYFHMHHKKICYSHNNAMKVFFYESGYKIWLPFYLAAVLSLQLCCELNIYLNIFLTTFAVLSSFAEVSHFWCHSSSKNALIKFLQNAQILLSQKHHSKHHLYDNTNYAFLNGMTDPLINRIAQWTNAGYKHHTDLHANN